MNAQQMQYLLNFSTDRQRRIGVKITDVKAVTLKGYKQWNYVQIETDAGLTGIGEAHPGGRLKFRFFFNYDNYATYPL